MLFDTDNDVNVNIAISTLKNVCHIKFEKHVIRLNTTRPHECRSGSGHTTVSFKSIKPAIEDNMNICVNIVFENILLVTFVAKQVKVNWCCFS